jgi:hypothetical protein
MSSAILNITEQPIVDESIEKYEFHEYEPVARSNLNSAGEIRIDVEKQDLFTHPSESYILFEGRLTKADGTAYANTDAVALTNNGLMHLFSQITYSLANQQVESVYHPGQATTMLGMLKYPDAFAKAQGLNQLWIKDTASTAAIADNTGFAVRQAYLIKKPTAKGTFSFIVPLKHIFGFCDDYDKIVYGFKHTLTLVRKSDDDAIFRAATVAAGKVNIDKISWFMPHIMPALMENLKLCETIEAKTTLSVAFRSRQCDITSIQDVTTFSWRLGIKNSDEKPRYIIVGFQTNRAGNQEANPSLFDHCDLRSMYIKMNQAQYPAVEYNLSFPNQQFARAYYNTATFSEKFYGMDQLITQSDITPVDFKDLFPIMVFDVSKRSEGLKPSSVDVQIKATFNTAVPKGTEVFAVVISDKMLNFTSNGSKISVV